MKQTNPVPIAKIYPDYYASGELYRCGEDFFLVHNPHFTDLCGKTMQVDKIAYLIVTHGFIQAQIDGKSVRINAGSSVITLSKQYIMVEQSSDDLECMLYFFTQKVVDSFIVRPTFALFREIQENPVVKLTDFSRQALMDVFQLMKTTLSHPDADQMLPICISLMNIAFRLAAPASMSQLDINSQSKNRDEKLTRLFLYELEANYREHREVAFYADLLCVTPKYLSTCVKSVTGYPANQWINRYVIRDAAQMLVSGNMPVKTVAAELKFGDQLLFGKYFKRQTGMSPTQYKYKKVSEL
ncbi:MAG: AraC family transcriptional regulator [Paludibacteraceae bacterium]|nr:AraC family transcriptional regulator [Paludibacteraceae bacterium]MBQ6764635.1 AraC family transcriptional regulator [Paludibacteraceae bacterium]